MPATMNRITQDEARRAVYVDFEGLRDAPPVLMGWLVDDSFTQTVVEGVLCPGAEARSLPVTSLEKAISGLVELARSQDRRIVGFSQHEANVMQELGVSDITRTYADAA